MGIRGKFILIGFVLLWFSILILVPFYSIMKEILKSKFEVIISSLISPSAIHSFFLTLIITIIVVLINTIFGILLAIVIVKQKFKGKLIFESLLDIPFAVSPVVVGFMLIILFGPEGWMGSIFSHSNIKIIYALPGMIIATLFVTLPFMAKEIIPVLREFDFGQEEAATVLGASKWQVFWKVILPSIKWGVAYGMTLTIARSIGEFGAVLVVSGNIINKTQTATIHIHDQFTDFNYATAFSSAIILIILSFILINTIQFLSRRKSILK